MGLWKLSRRSPAEIRLLLHALVLHLGIAVLLRVVTFGRLCRWGRALYPIRPRGDGEGSVPRVVWAVRTAASVVPLGRTCLSEALTAEWLLRVRGQSSTLRIGVDPASRDSFLAHAWLEMNGRPLLGVPARSPTYHALE